MNIEFVSAGGGSAQTAVALLVFEGGALAGPAAQLDQATQSLLTRAISASRFKGAKGQTLDVAAPAGVSAARIVLVGAGGRDVLDAATVEQAAAAAYAAVKASGLTTLLIDLSDLDDELAAHAGLGVSLAAYRFDRYRTKEPADKKPSIATVQIATGHAALAEQTFAPLAALADGVAFARDLVSEPANVLHPEEFARRVKALEPMGLSVEVLGEAEMEALGMGSLLCVGLGSQRESQLAVIQWKGAADPNAQPLGFVGKGVCFDTGGISLKPPEGMEDMKWDMGGAAAVAGLMHVLAGRKAKANVVGILGLVENMPDGKATRPGDVVTSMSGQTIEVINTDAEGRLVLADALWYCQERFKPRFMIDLATLTGAIIIALGHDYAGMFCNDDALADQLLAASKASGDALWRLPLPAAYEKQFDSMIADMKNVGGRPGGSITAALILQKFVNGVPWAHLDIASVAWKKPSSVATIPDGATGFGVRLLDRLVADSFEGLSAAMAQAGGCEVWFYHLERSGLDQVLPELLEKTLARGWRALVKAPDRDRIEHLDGWLWSYSAESFLAHGVAEDEDTAARQPVLLTLTDANLNGAQALVLVDGAEPGPLPQALEPYARCMILFDGRDEAAVERARGQWREAKAAHCPTAYWRQSEGGGWGKQA